MGGACKSGHSALGLTCTWRSRGLACSMLVWLGPPFLTTLHNYPRLRNDSSKGVCEQVRYPEMVKAQGRMWAPLTRRYDRRRSTRRRPRGQPAARPRAGLLIRRARRPPQRPRGEGRGRGSGGGGERLLLAERLLNSNKTRPLLGGGLGRRAARLVAIQSVLTRRTERAPRGVTRN